MSLRAFVATSIIVTFALGTAALDASVTVPRIVPRSVPCARASSGVIRTAKTIRMQVNWFLKLCIKALYRLVRRSVRIAFYCAELILPDVLQLTYTVERLVSTGNWIFGSVSTMEPENGQVGADTPGAFDARADHLAALVRRAAGAGAAHA